MSDTPLISLPLIESSQAQKHVTHNEALLLLDAVVHLAVISRVLATPPASPADGDRYLVAPSATGAWAGHSGHIAFREAGSWRFAIPKPGWRLWVQAESLFLLFDGTMWLDLRDFDELQNMNLLGVNTTADAANKLAVSSANVLFNHAGSDARVKLNKNATGDTAALLFQSGFSGRAEFGLTGDDDFHVKVSPNGSAWNESFIINRTSGLIAIRNGLVLDPQSSDPATPVDGQLWYNSTTNKFHGRQNGASFDLIATGGGGGFGDLQNRSCFHDDFTNAETLHYASIVSGAGAAVTQVPPGSGRFGVIRGNLGTTNTGRVRVSSNVLDCATAGLGILKWKSSMAVDTLSTSGERYSLRNGFIDSGIAESTDGIFFRYDSQVNGGRWETVTRSAGTETATDSGVPPSAGAYQLFDIAVNAAGTSVEFKINGTAVATHTANIPAGANSFGWGVMAFKSAGTAQTFAFLLDFWEVEQQFASPR